MALLQMIPQFMTMTKLSLASLFNALSELWGVIPAMKLAHVMSEAILTDETLPVLRTAHHIADRLGQRHFDFFASFLCSLHYPHSPAQLFLTLFRSHQESFNTGLRWTNAQMLKAGANVAISRIGGY